MKIELLLPVRDIRINQGFGMNYLNFYQQWGLKGHPGIDFAAKQGCKILASHTGIISWCGKGKDGGIGIEIWDESKTFKTFYYHHLKNENKIQKWIKVTAGEVIAEADNTGKYTTGDHEHFEMYFTNKDGQTLNTDNGYNGAVDPSPYFANRHGDKWYEPASYHRYGRKQEWLAEFNMRFKNVWLHRQLNKTKQINKINDTKFINKLCYGGWSLEDALNPAMNELTDNLKKSEYLEGKRPYV